MHRPSGGRTDPTSIASPRLQPPWKLSPASVRLRHHNLNSAARGDVVSSTTVMSRSSAGGLPGHVASRSARRRSATSSWPAHYLLHASDYCSRASAAAIRSARARSPTTKLYNGRSSVTQTVQARPPARLARSARCLDVLLLVNPLNELMLLKRSLRRRQRSTA